MLTSGVVGCYKVQAAADYRGLASTSPASAVTSGGDTARATDGQNGVRMYDLKSLLSTSVDA